MKKILICFMTTVIFAGIITFVLSNNLRKVNTVLDEYYTEYMPKNTGNIEIFKQERLGEYTFVLAEKYPGEGEASIDLFIINSNNDIVAVSTTDRAPSTCYTANSFIWEEYQVIFGELKDTKYNQVSEQMEQVDLKSLNVVFKTGEVIEKNIEGLEIFTIISDVKDEISEVNVYNEEHEIVSDLSETIYQRLDLTLLK